jgi:hypothetical protein
MVDIFWEEPEEKETDVTDPLEEPEPMLLLDRFA